jgi:hypothetical protein
VHFIEIGSTRYLVTGATDGYVAFWPLTGITYYDRGDNNNAAAAVVGSIEWNIHHAIHSSSIKSLEITKLSATCQLLIGGGDDNALSITTFCWFEENEPPVISTVSVPNAHASAITAIKILDVRNDDKNGSAIVNIASSGNDQRVKLWRVGIDGSSTKAISVSLDVNWYCAVADIAAMDVMNMPNNNDEGKTERVLVVAGVGMEMLRVKDDF